MSIADVFAPTFNIGFGKKITNETSDEVSAEFTLATDSYCTRGGVDLYIDTAFGTYLAIPHLGDQCQGQTTVCPPTACSPTCAEGATCGSHNDCQSGNCATNHACVPPACSPNCALGMMCFSNGECASQVCGSGTCQPPACSPTCANEAVCGANGDCASGACTNGFCAPPVCSPHCSQATSCGANGDCGSGVRHHSPRSPPIPVENPSSPIGLVCICRPRDAHHSTASIRSRCSFDPGFPKAQEVHEPALLSGKEAECPSSYSIYRAKRR